MNANFLSLRRQPYIDEQSFANTLAAYRRNDELAEEKLTERKDKPGGQHVLLGYIAAGRWREFQLRYTAGDPLHELAAFLAKVVEAYEREAEAKDELPEEEYSAVFTLDDPIDEYVDFAGPPCRRWMVLGEALRHAGGRDRQRGPCRQGRGHEAIRGKVVSVDEGPRSFLGQA
jgi:hypothetical protein